MNRYLIFMILGFSIQGYVVFGQLTIESCQEKARNNYPQIKQFELIEKSKEFTLSNANKAYLPQISFTAIGGYILGGMPIGGENGSNFTFIGLAQINQTIWDGGATKTQKDITKATAELEKASLEVSLYSLRSRINQLYFGILLVDEQLAQLDQKEKLLKNNSERIKQMNDNGLAYKTDLDEIKVELLKLNQQKKEYHYVRMGYIQMLSLFTGIQLDDKTTFEKPSKDNLILETEIVRPELKQYETQRMLLNAQGGMQRVSLMPKIGLLGAGVMIQPGMSLGASSLNSLGVAGLSASWNINGIYKNSNQKKLNQLGMEKINLSKETFIQTTNIEIAQARANVQKCQAILEDDNEIAGLQKSIREGYQLKYENGMSALLDLLDATEKESESQKLLSLHEMQLLMSLYELKTLNGK